MDPHKKIALVAHDNKKLDLIEWAKFNRDLLADHRVHATGTTGKVLEQELGPEIHKLQMRTTIALDGLFEIKRCEVEAAGELPLAHDVGASGSFMVRSRFTQNPRIEACRGDNTTIS